jgi:hypothetical protein
LADDVYYRMQRRQPATVTSRRVLSLVDGRARDAATMARLDVW